MKSPITDASRMTAIRKLSPFFDRLPDWKSKLSIRMVAPPPSEIVLDVDPSLPPPQIISSQLNSSPSRVVRPFVVGRPGARGADWRCVDVELRDGEKSPTLLWNHHIHRPWRFYSQGNPLRISKLRIYPSQGLVLLCYKVDALD
jgi:hypothetical protein